MAKMRGAFRAVDLRSLHPVTTVVLLSHVGDRLKKARPAGAAFEFMFGGKQRCAAADATVLTGIVVVPVGAGELSLSAAFARDAVLLRSKDAPPFVVRF